MSLINEALRKARQAASEHDSKQPDGPFQPARAYPSRRSGRRGGLLAMALIAIAASVVGAAAAWWILGDREKSSTEATENQSQPVEIASLAAPASASPAPSEAEANSATGRVTHRSGHAAGGGSRFRANMVELENSGTHSDGTDHRPQRRTDIRHGGRARLRLAQPRLSSSRDPTIRSPRSTASKCGSARRSRALWSKPLNRIGSYCAMTKGC